MNLDKAMRYLNDVIKHKNAVPFRRYNRGIGHHAQGHILHAPGNIACWPESACKAWLNILENADANAEAQGLEKGKVVINHCQVVRAPLTRRRTYRAHGRINAFQNHPCHIEVVCVQNPDEVPKPAEKPVRRISRKRIAQLRLARIPEGKH